MRYGRERRSRTATSGRGFRSRSACLACIFHAGTTRRYRAVSRAVRVAPAYRPSRRRLPAVEGWGGAAGYFRRCRCRWDRRALSDWPGRTARPISPNCRRRPSRLAASTAPMPCQGRSGRAPRREQAPDCGTSRSLQGGAQATIMWRACSLASRSSASGRRFFVPSVPLRSRRRTENQT